VSDDVSRRRRGALRSFVFGSVVGGMIAVAAPRVRRRSLQQYSGGLEAFEGAPCWEYDHADAGEPPGAASASPEAAEPTPEPL
jgi:hypothetical protein